MQDVVGQIFLVSVITLMQLFWRSHEAAHQILPIYVLSCLRFLVMCISRWQAWQWAWLSTPCVCQITKDNAPHSACSQYACKMSSCLLVIDDARDPVIIIWTSSLPMRPRMGCVHKQCPPSIFPCCSAASASKQEEQLSALPQQCYRHLSWHKLIAHELQSHGSSHGSVQAT